MSKDAQVRSAKSMGKPAKRLARHAGAAVGLGGALNKLAEQPFGEILLGVVAVGLCMYGLFSFTEARYGRLKR